MSTKLIFVLFFVVAAMVCLSWSETRVKRGGGGGGGGYGHGPGAGGGARGPVYFCGYVGGKEGSGDIFFDPSPVGNSKSESPTYDTPVTPVIKATTTVPKTTSVTDQKSKETKTEVVKEHVQGVESISRRDDGWDEYIPDLHKHSVITFIRSR